MLIGFDLSHFDVTRPDLYNYKDKYKHSKGLQLETGQPLDKKMMK